MPVPRLAGLPSSHGSDVALSPGSRDERLDNRLQPHAPEPLSEVVARFNVAIREQDWVTMRACCSDDAVIDSVTANEPLGPDETVAAVQAAYRAGIYRVREWQNEDLADDVVLSAGRVQYKPGPGQMRDSMFHWVTTGKDGRLWRVKAFETRKDALAHLEHHGSSLGF